MEEYDYEIVLKKGVFNTNADALSRVNRLIVDEGEPEEKRHQVINSETRTTILYENHDSPMGGHRGMNRTFRESRKKYEWPNMKRDVENFVKRCKSCQLNKTLGPRHTAPMEITSMARKPFEKCAMDIVDQPP